MFRAARAPILSICHNHTRDQGRRGARNLIVPPLESGFPTPAALLTASAASDPNSLNCAVRTAMTTFQQLSWRGRGCQSRAGVPAQDRKSGNGTRDDRGGSKKQPMSSPCGGRSSTLFTRRPLENHPSDRLDKDDAIDDRFDPGHVFRGDAQRPAHPLV